MNDVVNVVKRSGAVEPLDINKIHVMVEEACEGLAGVSVSQVEMNADLQFTTGIAICCGTLITIRTSQRCLWSL